MTTQIVAAKSKRTAASSTRFTVTQSSPSLWRVTFYNPPINLIDPVMIVELHHLLTEIEQDKRVAVVVFDTADPDFFLARGRYVSFRGIASDAQPFSTLVEPPHPVEQVARRDDHLSARQSPRCGK